MVHRPIKKACRIAIFTYSSRNIVFPLCYYSIYVVENLEYWDVLS